MSTATQKRVEGRNRQKSLTSQMDSGDISGSKLRKCRWSCKKATGNASQICDACWNRKVNQDKAARELQRGRISKSTKGLTN